MSRGFRMKKCTSGVVATRFGSRVSRAGFTLLELLVVLVILGLLASFVGPRYFDQLGRSNAKVARAQIDALEKALEHYRLDTGRYPTQEQGLVALSEKPADEARWAGPSAKKPCLRIPGGAPMSTGPRVCLMASR